MDDKIYFKVKELQEAMNNDPRFILLNKLENEINNNEEVMALSYRKDTANNHYNDLLKIYKEDDEMVIEARKKLFEAKKELDSHPLVKEYLKAYSEVEQLLYQVNQILFNDFKGKSC